MNKLRRENNLLPSRNITRRNFLKLAGAAAAMTVLPGCAATMAKESKEEVKEMSSIAKPGTGGDIYIPYEQRTGGESVVYFARDLSAAGLVNIFDRVKDTLNGKIAIKLHTGEPHGPNIVPRPWVKELMASRMPDSAIIETNTYYGEGRSTTEAHRRTLQINGWDFSPVDVIGTVMLPVPGGKWFKEMSVGEGLTSYDSFLALTHFKGHTMGGIRRFR